LYPKMPPGQRREAEMYQLVHQLPAASRFLKVHFRAQREQDRSAAGPPAAAVDLVATRGQHEEERAVGGEAPEVSLDERSRVSDPAEQLFLALAARHFRDGHGEQARLHAQIPERGV